MNVYHYIIEIATKFIYFIIYDLQRLPRNQLHL